MAKDKSGAKNTSLDIMSLIGWVAAIALIIFGIVFNSPPDPEAADYETKLAAYKMFDFAVIVDQFVDYPSLAITIGGTFAVLMIAFPGNTWGKIPKHIGVVVMPTKYDTQQYIEQITGFAREARMKGLLSLEDKLNESKDPFLRNSLMLVVDSVEPDKVHNLLEAELEHLDERHSQDRAFYDKGAGFAPSFGMIGTLIGLVKMLANMDDAGSIGPAMAVALLTTLYGSMVANLFFSPISNKLKVRHEEEYLCKVLICEGVEAIQAGENPKFIEEKLQMLVIQSKKGKKGKKGAAPAEGEA